MKQFIRFMVGDDYNTGIGRALRGFLAELWMFRSEQQDCQEDAAIEKIVQEGKQKNHW
jgi:hypothetical protein